jgi:hypothetical protein
MVAVISPLSLSHQLSSTISLSTGVVAGSVANRTVSVMVSIQLRKMFAEVRNFVLDARLAEQNVRESQAS